VRSRPRAALRSRNAPWRSAAGSAPSPAPCPADAGPSRRATPQRRRRGADQGGPYRTTRRRCAPPAPFAVAVLAR
jgi:hypothetical protein